MTVHEAFHAAPPPQTNNALSGTITGAMPDISQLSAPRIAQAFGRAAGSYDPAAMTLQLPVARTLVRWMGQFVARSGVMPRRILDVGCGTGLVTQEAMRQWPESQYTAIDVSQEMLRETAGHMPNTNAILGDATQPLFQQKSFDMIMSSLMLHWSQNAAETWRLWRSWLADNGTLGFSVLLDGSMREWDATCRAANIPSAIWPMPQRADLQLTDELEVSEETRRIVWPSAQSFLQTLSALGAHTGQNIEPISPGNLRRIFKGSPKPFVVSWRILYARMINRVR